MVRTATHHLCRQWIGPTSAATAVFAVIGGVGLVAAQLLRAPALPDGAGLRDVLLGAAPVLGEWVLPLGGLAGLVALLVRWRAEGEWLTLRAAGLGGRHLVPPVLACGLAIGGLTLALGHEGAPWGRATLFDVLVHQVSPRAGRATSVGGLTVLPGLSSGEDLHDLFLIYDGGEASLHAHAAIGRIAPDQGLQLEHGQALGEGFGLAFETLELPPPQATSRPPPSAWPGSQLAASDDPYHQAIGHKRSTWPVAAVLLMLLALPASLSGRAWTVGGAVVGWWVVVRTCDGLAPSLGGLGSALLPLALLGVATAWTWRRWGDR